jgi:hypothetical protein
MQEFDVLSRSNIGLWCISVFNIFNRKGTERQGPYRLY